MKLGSARTLTVAAVLAPSDRARLDAAAAGSFSVVHRGSIGEAAQVVREQSVDAVVVSVHEFRESSVELVDSLVRRFPEVPTVALVTRPDAELPDTLLRLGASGVKHVVDVTGPTGWNRLRRLVSEPASRPAARILRRFFDAVPDLPADTRMFIELLVRSAPHTPVVRKLARQARVGCNTLTSRFARAGLPSPKTYLAAIRLLYAAQYFENEGLSVTDVAYRLECSSPQSFGRHLRAALGVTPGEFRRRYSFEDMIQRFIVGLVEPFAHQWKELRAFEGRTRRTVAGPVS
jgi:AraC-like DNA-binding protein